MADEVVAEPISEPPKPAESQIPEPPPKPTYTVRGGGQQGIVVEAEIQSSRQREYVTGRIVSDFSMFKPGQKVCFDSKTLRGIVVIGENGTFTSTPGFIIDDRAL